MDAPVAPVPRWSNIQLTSRAVLALLVLIAFYVFALATVVFLLFLTWLQLQIVTRPGGGYTFLWLLIVPPIGALLILLAILPRGPRLGYPGRGLNPKRAPELFELIRDVARQTRQRMPRAVYIADIPNAGVGSRGLFLGQFMMIGIPFLGVLTVGELRAVVAHEFGHHRNRTGPITRTVYNATRTLGAAAAAAGAVPFLDGVFEIWAEIFLHIAMPISRQYELRCDEVARRIAGVEPTISALTKISNIDDSEMINPIAGWEDDPRSTHPPLRDRVASARALNLPPPSAPADDRPAMTLLQSQLASTEESSSKQDA